ncbi:MAG: tRNA uridine-5-carboxymethylaminomethyl(34) synthesis GTPase MnmE [Muribaculaceae bacterium]|nr:tRNA uridine-5-carboxymethylaminomethyl(34) synthesis GTPase MnmE [Muribaculaceae bacterium]
MIGNEDTICAISTPPGVGGIAVIRVSGHDAIAVCDKLWQGKALSEAASHTAHFGVVADAEGNRLDEAVATVFRAPRSFTGEDVVELSVHGSVYIQRELINALCEAGARLAERGEFTQRAFASGRFDLAQAEAVADIIAADSKASHRLAMSQMRGDFSSELQKLHDKLLELVSLLELELDFSEEDVEFASRERLLELANHVRDTVRRLAHSFRTGDAIKRGVSVAIVGETNAGKSTLLNRLLRDDKAIVSDVHGTTRDIIEDTVDLDGVCFRFIDTAGLRKTDDTIETQGIERAIKRLESARIVLWVVDATRPDNIAATAEEVFSHISDDQAVVIVINKTDTTDSKAARRQLEQLGHEVEAIIDVSAADGNGIDNLEHRLVEISGANDISASDVIVTNARHHRSLVDAEASLTRAIDGINASLSGDFIAQDLRETLHHLSTITGTITTSDILQTIFSKFCIGK